MQRELGKFVLMIKYCPNYNVQITNFEYYRGQEMCNNKRGEKKCLLNFWNHLFIELEKQFMTVETTLLKLIWLLKQPFFTGKIWLLENQLSCSKNAIDFAWKVTSSCTATSWDTTSLYLPKNQFWLSERKSLIKLQSSSNFQCGTKWNIQMKGKLKLSSRRKNLF